ncbi:MAG TPA: hypothetical protein VHC21_04620 [Candidatus Saccharimonadales bacterium]|nr:hypothetical protein [Candidatus Saccharimonadales bacterium]
MPRLSKKEYWQWHVKLRWLWLNHQYFYKYLSPTKQWILHDFFQPSKDISREELLAHRKAITKERPGLPHQAGWALRDLNQMIHRYAKARKPAPAPVTNGRGKSGAKRVKVTGSLVRPEIDPDQMARVLWKIVERKSKLHDL